MTLRLLPALALLLACNSPRLPAAYRLGARLEREGRDAEALAEYREAAAGCAEDTAACRQCRVRVAETLARLGRHGEASESYLALRRWTRDPAAAARAQERAAGLLESPLREPHRALALYRATMLGFPAEVAAEDALRRLCDLVPRLSAEGDAKLVRVLTELYDHLQRSPLADNILFAAAHVYERRGDPGQALRLLDRLWRGYEGSSLWDDSLWRAGQILEEQARWSEAVERYRRLVATRKRAFLLGSYNSEHLDDAQLRIGVIRLEHLGDTAGAIAALRSLRDELRDSILRDDAQWWIAKARFHEGKSQRACAALRRLVRDFPDGNHVRRAKRELADRCR